MGKKIVSWESNRQFDNNLTANNLTKIRYGYNTNDYIALTNEKEFTLKYIPTTGEILKGDNQQVEYVSESVRFKFSVMKNENHMDDDLYFQKISYNDFFNGFEDKKEIESVTTILAIDETTSIYDQFDAFFMSLEPDIEINEEEYVNLTYGFHSFDEKYTYYKKVNYDAFDKFQKS